MKNTTKKKEKLYTCGEVADMLQVSKVAVRKWGAAKKIESYLTPGGHRRYKKSDLKSFIIENNMYVPELMELGSQKKILMIDDDKYFLQIISIILRKYGFFVATTSNSYEAGMLTPVFQPNLILLDIMMPKLDGFEVVNILKSNQDLKNIPIIALTGITNPDKVKKIKECGVNDYIPKPITDNDKFVEVIKKNLKLFHEVPVEV